MTNADPNPQAERGNWQAARDEGARLIDAREYEGAIKTLQESILGDPSGESHALLGLAHYQREEYQDARRHYEAALKRAPANDDWRRMGAMARDDPV